MDDDDRAHVDNGDGDTDIKVHEEKGKLPNGNTYEKMSFTVLLNKGRTSFDIAVGTKVQTQVV